MTIRRVLAALGLTVFLAVLMLMAVQLSADSLYRERLDARAAQEESADAQVTTFSLFAKEIEHQTKSRVAGWLSAVQSQEVTVVSGRGKLCATQFEPLAAAQDAPFAILFHGGLGTDREQVIDLACALSLRGYRVLTPDLYAHGASEGTASTLGVGDAQDVRAWVDYAHRAQMGAQVVLFGFDEGAAAVLGAACDGLGGQVAAVAADSAFDDGKARMLALAGAENQAERALLSLAFRRRTGQRNTALSSRIAAADVPLLLIHGTGDEVVPAWQSEDIARAAGDNARLLYIEGAGHGMARFLDETAYYDALLGFFEEALQR